MFVQLCNCSEAAHNGAKPVTTLEKDPKKEGREDRAGGKNKNTYSTRLLVVSLKNKSYPESNRSAAVPLVRCSFVRPLSCEH